MLEEKQCEIQVSLTAYSKLLCHVMQYPYTSVNGVLLAPTSQTTEDEVLNVVDCVPLFHYTLSLTPMFIVALTQVIDRVYSCCHLSYYDVSR